MSERKQASRGAVDPVIHLIFVRCSGILVCRPLGKVIELAMHCAKLDKPNFEKVFGLGWGLGF